MACTVPGCVNRVGVLTENNAKVSFHRFPADIELRNMWITNVRKGDNWRPTQYTRICSAHFEDSCFREGYGRRVLHSHAVPTIFPKLPVSCQPKLPSKRKLVAKYDDAVPSTSSAYENDLRCTLPKVSRMTQTDTTDAYKDCQKELEKARKLALHYKTIAIRRGRNLKNIQRKYNRLVKKKADMETIIQALHQKMEGEHVEILKNTMDVKNQIVSRYLMKLRGGSLPKEYPDEVKKFALTLHFLSPKAYNHVRDCFETVLPHPKTISRWYKSVDCKPGFTEESLEIIKLRSRCANKTLYCALVIDEVAIRKQLEWDGTKYYGHIDFGIEDIGDDLPLACEALTFMVTCINESWKIPVGYFLINGLSAQQKRNLVDQCLRLLKDSVTVVSLTFDGAAANGAMATLLGCDLNPANLKTTFEVDEHEVAILYDPCHNIKLIRNTLGDKKTLLDADNNVISWDYFEMLHALQMEEGLHAGNKLSAAHVRYDKQKMKVRLATQLLSNSIADALEFCLTDEIPGFENCSATIRFVRIFNDIFDILNSRNLVSRYFKKPLCSENIDTVKEKMEEIYIYINGLKFSDGTSVLNSRRKTGFIGFQICIKSILFIYDKYISVGNPYLTFLPTYKLSQDHIEIFFSAIRSLGGFNNNPSAKAFMTAYKKLLVHAEFKISRNGNCLPLDDIRILHANKKQYIHGINETALRNKLLDDDIKIYHEKNIDHDYIPDPSLVLSEYSDNVVTYISGFIVRKIKKEILCEECFKALINETSNSCLLKVKDRGGLIKASTDVVYICKKTESIFRRYMISVGVTHIGKPFYIEKIIMTVFEICARSDVFSQLINHCYDNCILNNHLHLIIKAIVNYYLKIRIHHECKKASAPDGEIVRNYFNKLVIFKGQ